MAPVLRGEPHVLRPGELTEQVGEVAAGLLVLPVAGEIHGHVDLADEVLGRERKTDRVGPEPFGVDQREDVGGLAVQRLVREADLVAGLDAIRRPRLSAAGRGLGVVLAVLRPRDGEAGVEDAAGVERAADGVVDHRQRRDRGEVRRLQLRDEELADPRVRQADHPDLVVRDPRLRGDRLDRVVAVGRLQLLEEVERAARTSGAAHVHADGRVAERLRDLRARLRRLRIGGRVARVLDDGRVRALVGRTGKVHRHRQQDAVAGAQVSVTVPDLLRRVERRGRRTWSTTVTFTPALATTVRRDVPAATRYPSATGTLRKM